MFLNGKTIADELLNIQFSLTTIKDASPSGIQTYFIYSSRIIGKLSLISIENCYLLRFEEKQQINVFTIHLRFDSFHSNITRKAIC